jgi:MFS family permease
MVALLVTDLVGGLWAGASGVNSWGDAWGSQALLAAPAPMIVGQLLTAYLAVRYQRRWAAIPAGLLALACLVSAVSGFFDGGLGNDALEPGMAAFQVFLLVVTGVVGVLAAVRAVALARSASPGRAPEADADPHYSAAEADKPL